MPAPKKRPRLPQTSRAKLIKRELKKMPGARILSIVSAFAKQPQQARMLLAKGLNARRLQTMGLTVEKMVSTGYKPEELEKLGYNVDEFIGANVNHLENLGYGLDAMSLERRGTKIRELSREGRPLRELIREFGLRDVVRGGNFSAYALIGIVGSKDLVRAGLGVKELSKLQYTAFDLRSLGFSPKDLIRGGFRQSEVNYALSKEAKKAFPRMKLRRAKNDGEIKK